MHKNIKEHTEHMHGKTMHNYNMYFSLIYAQSCIAGCQWNRKDVENA